MNIDKKRIQGLIYGCAVGDAYGMATEMMTSQQIKRLYGRVVELMDSHPESIISKDRVAGSITDDTLNSLMILEMIRESGGVIDVDAYIHKLISWSKSSPIAGFVTGPSTARALSLIEQGVPLSETGRMGTTNGAAMKIAPLGIVCDYQDLDSLIAAVQTICLPTHNTSIAIAGASVITAISSYILSGQSNWNAIWDLAFITARKASTYGQVWPCASLEYRLRHAKEIVDISNDEEAMMNQLYDEIGTGLETIETVPSALALAYYAKGDVIRCAQYCASIGGDTDTLGAIATALSGAMHPDIDQAIIDTINKANSFDLSSFI